MACGQTGGRENGPTAGGLGIEPDSVFRRNQSLFILGRGEKKLPEPFGRIGILWVELVGFLDFLNCFFRAIGSQKNSAEKPMGFRIPRLFQDGETDIRLRPGKIPLGQMGHGTAKKKSGIVGMPFDDGRNCFFRFGVVLLKNRLFRGGYGRIKEGIFSSPFGKKANIGECARFGGLVPKPG